MLLNTQTCFNISVILCFLITCAPLSCWNFVKSLDKMNNPTPTPENVLSFFDTVGKLKLLKRTGWINHEIPLPESVADHMYRMTMLCFAISDPTIKRDRLMKICLVHDLAEAIVGDITPHDGVTKEEKRKLEETAMQRITNELDFPLIGDELNELWLEYENGDTIEARIAKQLDKFEMIKQADEYEKSSGKVLESFFLSTQDSFEHPEILNWANLLREKRNQRLLAIS